MSHTIRNGDDIHPSGRFSHMLSAEKHSKEREDGVSQPFSMNKPFNIARVLCFGRKLQY